jgi:hypothetical protein
MMTVFNLGDKLVFDADLEGPISFEVAKNILKKI